MLAIIVIGVLALARLTRPQLLVTAASYVLLAYTVIKPIAARILFGGHASAPPAFQLINGQGASPSFVGRLLPSVIFCLFGSLAFLLAVITYGFAVIAHHYSTLPVGILATALFGAIAYGAWNRLFPRLGKGAPHRSPRHKLSPEEKSQIFQAASHSVAPKILIDEAAFDSGNPRDVVQAIVDSTNWMMDVALLVPGEFPREAVWIYYVDYYIAQVNNGGHAQFAFNSRMSPAILDNIENGLSAIGASDLLAIVKDLRAMPLSDAEFELDKMAFDKLSKLPMFKVLDERFFALKSTERVAAESVAWLRHQHLLRSLPLHALIREREAIKARNRLYELRQSEAARLRVLREAADPTRVAAMRLCAAAGLIFEGLTTGTGDPNAGMMIWGVQTSKGIRIMSIGPEAATLLESDYKTIIAGLRLPIT